MDTRLSSLGRDRLFALLLPVPSRVVAARELRSLSRMSSAEMVFIACVRASLGFLLLALLPGDISRVSNFDASDATTPVCTFPSSVFGVSCGELCVLCVFF